MKKIFKSNIIVALVALILTLCACEDFLNRPSEDQYTIDGFFQTDEQCYQAANILYNSPWYDFQRMFTRIDILAGNEYYGITDAYQTFAVTANDQFLQTAMASPWEVNAHANAVIENVANLAGPDVSQAVKNTVTGEAMTWKALAYFYLVRLWGAVPIIHNNTEIVGAGTANDLYKIRVEDIYEYIIRTLRKAATLLPEENLDGRLNKYSAYGLLSKVFLTASGYGQTGTRDQNYLDSAKYYAGKVINEYTGTLEPVYSNLFRISTGNYNSECLITWRWVISLTTWTSQNTLQADLALGGNFTQVGDGWGSYTGPTIDLQRLYNDSALSLTRNNTDVRRKATCMMYGDYYPYFWRDHGGFTATFINDATDEVNNPAATTFGSNTGAQNVKHIVGNTADHEAEDGGVSSANMRTNLATHVLRLADVYLIYAEAVLGNNASTTDAEALRVYNAVKRRSIPSWSDATSITFRDIFDERRRELAIEGDNWFDYVRLSYYNPTLAIQMIEAQDRGGYDNAQLREYYAGTRDMEDVTYTPDHVNIDASDFTLPFPDIDVNLNPHLLEDPVPFDFSTIDY